MSSGRTPAFVVVFFVAVGAWCNCAAIAERSADSERSSFRRGRPKPSSRFATSPKSGASTSSTSRDFTGNRYIVEIMGSGAGFLDHGQDGDYDLYLLNGAPLPGTPPPPDPPRNRFFQNDGHGNFEEVTTAVGLGDEGYGMGIAVGDIDNDGDSDLFLSNYGADRLFRNRRDGTFEDITEWAGIDLPQWSTSAVFFDFDLDGTWISMSPATSISTQPPPSPGDGRVFWSTADRKPMGVSAISCCGTTAPGGSPRSPRRWASPIALARAWASSPEISRATVIPISTWPTTGPPTSSISTTAKKGESTSPRRPFTTAPPTATAPEPRRGWERTWATLTATSISISR